MVYSSEETILEGEEAITRSLRLVLSSAVLVAAASAALPAQRGTPLTAEQAAGRWELENELQSLAIVERKVMMPMRDGVRLATDIYRPKNAGGEGADRLRADAVQLQLLGRAQRRAGRHDRGAHRGQARLRLRRPERARPFLLRRQLRHPRPADHRRLRRASTGCRSSRGRTARSARPAARRRRNSRWRVARCGSPRVCGDDRAGIRRRRRPRRPVLRAGQLVSRRRGADALHRVALRPAEPGAADVPAEHVAGGPDPRVEVVRPRAASAAGRLVEGALASAGAGHHEGRRRAARHLRRRDAGRHRRAR